MNQNVILLIVILVILCTFIATGGCDSLGEGDVEESTLGEFYDYYDDEHRLLEEIFNDPLVKMVEQYSEPHQYSLFDSEYVKKYKQNKLDNHFIEA